VAGLDYHCFVIPLHMGNRRGTDLSADVSVNGSVNGSMGGCVDARIVRERIAAEIKRAGSQARYAKKMGMSQPMLSQILSGERRPGEELLAKLGYRAVEHYERIGK